MAWLEQNSDGVYRLILRLGGEREAQARLVRVEENIRIVESGR